MKELFSSRLRAISPTLVSYVLEFKTLLPNDSIILKSACNQTVVPGFAFVTAGDGSSGKTGGGGAPKLGTPKHRSKSTTADNTSATQGSKQSRSRKGSASDKQQKQKLERKNSAGGGGGMALSRSRKNSVENCE